VCVLSLRMDAFDARSLCVIAEELSEEDEADEEEFVMVQDSHTPDAFCSPCRVLTHTGAAAHARHTRLALGPAAQQMKVRTSHTHLTSHLCRCVCVCVCDETMYSSRRSCPTAGVS